MNEHADHGASPPGPPAEAPAIRGRTVVTVFGALVLVTAVVAGTVLGLGKAVPAVREHLVTVLAWTVVVHGLLALLLTVVVLRRAGVTGADVGLVRPGPRLWNVLWQVPVALVLVVIVNGIVFTLMGADGSSGGGMDSVVRGAGPSAVAAVFVGGVVLAPLWEELVYRGVLYGHLRRRGVVWAFLGTAVVFAVSHLVPILFPYLLTMGLLLAWLRHTHGNLWGPLALHMTINCIATLVALLALG